ncbi:Protein CBG21294 [Caenorhabditis briggsae]|uniref:Protein CBG21294 n=1 Tax=Caenorhabditis briggsae TaxID=6238 RepID=A8XZS5_CAEBR|nr:Protein CBG21294 [Caenorhabditis briggsae]CAP38142.2 Protein CBG21294 [Caenorhabditis briggsae]
MVQAMFPHLIGNPESANSIIRNAFTHFLPDHKPHNSPDRHRTIYKHVLEGMVKKGHSPYLSQFAVKKLAKFAEVCPKRIINWFVSGRHELKNRIRFGFRPLGLRAKRSETDSVVIKLLDEGVRLYESDVEKLYRFGIPDEEKITRSGEEVAPFMKVLVYVYHKLTSIDKNAMIGRSEAMLLSKTLDLSGPEKVTEGENDFVAFLNFQK